MVEAHFTIQYLPTYYSIICMCDPSDVDWASLSLLVSPPHLLPIGRRDLATLRSCSTPLSNKWDLSFGHLSCQHWKVKYNRGRALIPKQRWLFCLCLWR